MEAHRTTSVAGTLALGEELGQRLKQGDCVSLVGNLGAGKTALVRGIARGLGVTDARMVSSPTFVLVQEYAGRLPIYHIDLYRLHDAPAELEAMGLDEMLADGVVLIEWADRAAKALPSRRWNVSLEIAGARSRRITIEQAG
jgi:tRNA threonylcarbamoyladenosine biosynthesis protein TsaE